MRKVVVQQAKEQTGGLDSERLIALLAAGLERLLTKRAQSGQAVDFGPDESVTTTCPNAGEQEETTS